MRPLSVEIFRDEDSRHLSPEIAEHGIDNVDRIVRGIEIVRATRLFRMPVNAHGWVESSNRVRWPKFPADLNVILTEKPIAAGPDSKTLGDGSLSVGGVAHVDNTVDGLRVAIINTTLPFADIAVAHETGHLLNLKNHGSTCDGEGHCVNDDCIMHPSQQPEITFTSQYIGRRGIFRRKSYREKATGYKSSTEQFCEECSHQARVNSFMLQKAKSGEYVPPDLLG